MTLIVSTTALAPRTAPILMPLADIALWAYPGVNRDTSLINYADDDNPMTLGSGSGTVLYGDRYSDMKSVTSGAWFESNIDPAGLSEWSLISIYQPLDASPYTTATPQAISCYSVSGGAASGFGLGAGATVSGEFRGARGSYAGGSPGSESAVQTPITALDPLMIRAIAFRGKNGGVMRVDDLTEGTSAAATDTRTIIVPSTLTSLRIGSSGSGTNRYGRSRHFFDCIIPRSISDDELDKVIGQAVRSLAADGVSVTIAG